jgi:hypothetical protein
MLLHPIKIMLIPRGSRESAKVDIGTKKELYPEKYGILRMLFSTEVYTIGS